MHDVGGEHAVLPRAIWGGARGDDGELLHQMPGVNAPVALPSAPTAGQSIADFDAAVKLEGRSNAEADIEGALDRQSAQRDLAKKLQIVGKDHKGPRAPNQVSQAEFEELSHTYSNIRLGRGDLTIDASRHGDPAQYKADMMDDIGDIMQTESGRALISQLSNNTNGRDSKNQPIHRHTTLGAFVDDHGQAQRENARSRALDVGEGKNLPYPSGAAGRGSDALVEVNPNVDIDGSRSDVVIFHELVHALTDTQGITDQTFVDAKDGPDPGVAKDGAAYIARQEHQAGGLGRYRNNVITENHYRRERQRLGLSAQGLPGDLTMPERKNYSEAPEPYSPFFGR